ncbi:MAG TPA: DUF6714 family protein [Abditibacteriaceae bacterium]|jgi:hypothetical protein
MNSSANKKIAALISEITVTFDGVSREGGVSLHEAAGIDDYESSDDERAVNRAKDTDTKWQDVPDEDIEYGYVVLNYLDPKGFRYYIPAYMIWVLNNLENCETQSMTFDAVAYTFVGYKSADQKAKCSLLTVKQSKAIAHFLRFWVDHTEKSLAELGLDYDQADDERQQSLNYYWSQFL